MRDVFAVVLSISGMIEYHGIGQCVGASNQDVIQLAQTQARDWLG
jgi:hypothetical protein